MIPEYLLKLWVPLHLLAIVGIVAAIMTGLSPWWLVLTIIGWVLVSGLGSAVGLHRILSHNAIPTTKLTKRVLGTIGCFAGHGSPMFWVALHRGYHHAHADTPKDYHSPTMGKFNAYMGWMFKMGPKAINMKYAIDLARDNYQVWLHRNYYAIVWTSIIVLALFSWQASLFFLVLPMVYGIHQDCCVNLFCHLRSCGYRSYDTSDNSVNVYLLGLFAWGQGWHNNHHEHPNRFNFGERWWEIDATRIFIPFIKATRHDAKHAKG